MRTFQINIIALLIFALFLKCNTRARTDENAEQAALHLISNIDSNSIQLLKEYSYGRRGVLDFWQKISADTTLYACTYKANDDTAELTVFRPLNFIDDFSSSFNFDTSTYYQYKFFERNDSIVKILRVDNHGQDHMIDTFVSRKALFPNQNPFAKFADLTNLKDKLGFIGTSYINDGGEIIVFWITSQYKLTYLPDTLKMNPKSKKYWIDDFEKGKIIKDHWSLQKVYE